MTLTTENIFSESYNIIKSFLNGITGIDPRSRYKANWIHSSLPNINSKGFDGYPFIVLKVEVSGEDKTFDSNSTQIFRVTLQIYSNEATDIDTISNLIKYNYNDETLLTDFAGREFTSSPFGYTLDLNGKKISYRIISLIFRKKI